MIMARRKLNNNYTTICITWTDKELFRKFAQFVKDTKTGQRTESDSVLFHRILADYNKANPLPEDAKSKSTYPSRA